MRYPGNYDRLRANCKEEKLRRGRSAPGSNQQAEIRREETSFIKKHMGSQRTAEAKGRQQEALPRRAPAPAATTTCAGRSSSWPRSSAAASRCSRRTSSPIGYDGDTPLIRGHPRSASVAVSASASWGPNGAGKTTLLKVLAGQSRGRWAARSCSGHKAQLRVLRPGGRATCVTTRPRPTVDDPPRRTRRLDGPRDPAATWPSSSSAATTIDAVRRGPSRAANARGSRSRELVLTEPSPGLPSTSPPTTSIWPARTALEEMLSSFPGAHDVRQPRPRLPRRPGRHAHLRGRPGGTRTDLLAATTPPEYKLPPSTAEENERLEAAAKKAQGRARRGRQGQGRTAGPRSSPTKPAETLQARQEEEPLAASRRSRRAIIDARGRSASRADRGQAGHRGRCTRTPRPSRDTQMRLAEIRARPRGEELRVGAVDRVGPVLE